MDLEKDIVLGVYISGSHITSALVDMNNKKIVDQTYHRVKVNAWGSLEHIIGSWCGGIRKSLKDVQLQDLKIGIAMPGQFDYASGICYIRGNKKYESLYGVNVKEMLARELGIPAAHICMLNDAAAFLHGELFAGAIENSAKVIALTLGTGLGTAVFSNGSVRDAELWNSPFLDGKAENYISTKWLLSRYFELTRINILNIKALNKVYNESSTARAIFKEFTANLSLLVKGFVEAEQPELIVFGGDIMLASERFVPDLQKILHQHQIDTPVHVSSLGDHAAIYGASTCWTAPLAEL